MNDPTHLTLAVDGDGARGSFEAAVDERQGFVRAEIISATELNARQREELLHALGTKVGKFIRPVYKID